ncbi:zinc finger, CCHC-type containing protein [Tanacetum coccineum]
MSGNKNENKVVFATSLPSYQCPVLNNTNYALWALRMKKILMANGVWDLVEGTSTSKEIDVKKDSSGSGEMFLLRVQNKFCLMPTSGRTASVPRSPTNLGTTR